MFWSTNYKFSSINPNSAAWGEIVTIYGAGFSEIITDNSVYFTSSTGSPLAGTIIQATKSEITVIVPYGASTGDLWVATKVNGIDQLEESNKLYLHVSSNILILHLAIMDH